MASSLKPLPKPSFDSSTNDLTTKIIAINQILPQTQCTKCGYSGCEPYATAIAKQEAPINQCPPGGAQGIAKLAALLECDILELNPLHGEEKPRQLAIIEEAHCIGCTLCIQACPVDAIMGANKRMHTVIQSLCTGCDLCIPACPVDCIRMIDPSPALPTWQTADAVAAKARFEQREKRLEIRQHEQEQKLIQKAEAKRLQLQAVQSDHLQNTNLASITDNQFADQTPEAVNKKLSIVEAALAKARARQANRTAPQTTQTTPQKTDEAS